MAEVEEPRDTGDLAEVDPALWVSTDGGDGSDASSDELEDALLAEVYADPGVVVEKDLA